MHVRGRFCTVPTFLDEIHHFTFAVRSVHVALECHVRFVERLYGYITVVHLYAMSVLPGGDRLFEEFHTCSDTQSVHIAFGIFPSVLKQDKHLGAIVSGYCFGFATALGAGHCLLGRDVALIVEDECFGSFGERNTALNVLVRIVG